MHRLLWHNLTGVMNIGSLRHFPPTHVQDNCTTLLKHVTPECKENYYNNTQTTENNNNNSNSKNKTYNENTHTYNKQKTTPITTTTTKQNQKKETNKQYLIQNNILKTFFYHLVCPFLSLSMQTMDAIWDIKSPFQISDIFTHISKVMTSIIWNQHEKCIEIGTNKSMFDQVILRMTFLTCKACYFH